MQPEFVQTTMGIIGSLGFALLFGIRGTKPLGCIAFGSGIGWVVYLVSVAGGNADISSKMLCQVTKGG